MIKHGVHNFKLTVLCCGSLEYISDLENKAIDAYDSRDNGYNILKGHHSKNLELPAEVRERISKGLNSYYENNTSASLGRKFDECYNDNPVYVLGFWFPSVRFCEQVFGKYYSWVMERNGTEQEYIPPDRKLRKDAKHQSGIYVGGFWWPSVKVASEHLKMSRGQIMMRLRRGTTEEISTAARVCKLADKNPMFGRNGELHHNSRKVFVEGKIYGSVLEAIRETTYTKKQIYNRLNKDKYEDFYYVT